MGKKKNRWPARFIVKRRGSWRPWGLFLIGIHVSLSSALNWWRRPCRLTALANRRPAGGLWGPLPLCCWPTAQWTSPGPSEMMIRGHSPLAWQRTRLFAPCLIVFNSPCVFMRLRELLRRSIVGRTMPCLPSLRHLDTGCPPRQSSAQRDLVPSFPRCSCQCRLTRGVPADVRLRWPTTPRSSDLLATMSRAYGISMTMNHELVYVSSPVWLRRRSPCTVLLVPVRAVPSGVGMGVSHRRRSRRLSVLGFVLKNLHLHLHLSRLPNGIWLRDTWYGVHRTAHLPGAPGAPASPAAPPTAPIANDEKHHNTTQRFR